MQIKSELQLFRYLKHTYLEHKIERTVYNKRKRKLFSFLELIRNMLCQPLHIYRPRLLWIQPR